MLPYVISKIHNTLFWNICGLNSEIRRRNNIAIKVFDQKRKYGFAAAARNNIARAVQRLAVDFENDWIGKSSTTQRHKYPPLYFPFVHMVLTKPRSSRAQLMDIYSTPLTNGFA
jgi:hypothetical protein